MRKLFVFLLLSVAGIAAHAQKYNIDSSLASLKFKKDSVLHAMKVQRDSVYSAGMHGDSIKVEKEYKEKLKWENLKTINSFPVINAGENSGVVAVADITERPDPKMDYKLLFELSEANPDSSAKEMNYSLVEAVRKINLHVAGGVPLKRIFPVFVVHGSGLWAFTTNEAYREKFKMDNPNLKVINELQALGAKFIGCGQAMAFMEIKKAMLLPLMKVALSAQIILSTYQLKGYVLYRLW